MDNARHEPRYRASAADNPEDLARASILLIFSITAFGVCVGSNTTVFMGIASASYGLMIAGMKFRRTREIHVPAMSIALATDVLLVLILELNRHAINTSVSGNLSAFQHAHIIFSTVAIILYIPLVALGYQLFQRSLGRMGRLFHMRLGFAAFLFRTIGFILMFSMLSAKN